MYVRASSNQQRCQYDRIGHGIVTVTISITVGTTPMFKRVFGLCVRERKVTNCVSADTQKIKIRCTPTGSVLSVPVVAAAATADDDDDEQC